MCNKHMKTKHTTTKTIIKTAFIGLIAGATWLTASPKVHATDLSTNYYGGLTISITGQDYYDYTKMTNPPSTSIYISPPNTNATSCYITNDISAGHTWRITVLKKGNLTYLQGTNSMLITNIVGTATYQILYQDLTAPGLPNGTHITCKAVWSH